MRHLVLAAAIFALAACGGERSASAPAAGKGGGKSSAGARAPGAATSAPAEASEPAPATKPADPLAAKSINTICPVTGLAVDPSIPPVEVVIDVVQPPLVLLIGVNNAEAAKRVAADPERFAAAARNNREARSTTNPASGAGQR